MTTLSFQFTHLLRFVWRFDVEVTQRQPDKSCYTRSIDLYV